MPLQDLSKYWGIIAGIIGTIIGCAVTYGKLISKMSNFITKEELNEHCRISHRRISDEIGERLNVINTSIKDMEKLVIRLHDSQSKKIDTINDKREIAKGDSIMQLDIFKKETNRQFINLTQSIGRLEGKIEQIKSKGG